MAEAEALEASGVTGQSVMPLMVRGRMKDVDMEGVQYDPDDVDLSGLVRSAKSEGFDGLRMNNFSDEAGYGVYNPASHSVVFDPKNIRSVNAAFDPAKADSANLLAANNKNAAGVGAVMSQEVDNSIIPKQTWAERKAYQERRQEQELSKSRSDPETYRMQHTAPTLDGNPSARDLNSVMPDVYGPRGLDYYGTGAAYDSKAIAVIRSMHEKPDNPITIYRAAPEGSSINPGDWVTTTREYALQHIGGDKGYKVIKKKVMPSELAHDGNSIHEFGYAPPSGKNKLSANPRTGAFAAMTHGDGAPQSAGEAEDPAVTRMRDYVRGLDKAPPGVDPNDPNLT